MFYKKAYETVEGCRRAKKGLNIAVNSKSLSMSEREKNEEIKILG